MAKRSARSSTSSTSLPCAAKNSAAVVAARAALMRISGDWSESRPPLLTGPCSGPSESSRTPPLAASLANQPHHGHIGFSIAGHHANQGALATPDPRRLPLAGPGPRSEGRRSPYSGAQRGANGARSSGERTAPSKGRVAQEAGGRPSSMGAPSAFSTLPISPGPTSISGCTASASTESQSGCPPSSPPASTAHGAAESDHLGQMGVSELVCNLAALSHRGQRTRRFDSLAHRFDDLSAPAPGCPRSSRSK